MPKEEGGLGVKDPEGWNVALLSKVLWNIHRKKDSLWVRWVHHSYLLQHSIWNLSPHREHSTLMRRLLSIRDQIIDREGSVAQAIARMEDWKHSGLTKMAYQYFRSSAQKVPWAATVWSSYIPPKYSFTVWLGVRGRLLTRDRLDYLHIDQRCGFCRAIEESIQHLFFACPFTRAIWDDLWSWC